MTTELSRRLSDASLPQESALIIYEHGLLGEGIAARLRDRGVPTVVVERCDAIAVASALAARPTVVIAERTTLECERLINSLSPDSRIIDVSLVIGRGCQSASEMVHFEAILSALSG
jgi:hypothetical protein